MDEKEFRKEFITNHRSIGRYLKHCRIKKKHSVRTLAESVFLQESFISSLEEDAFEKLPAKIYSLGLLQDVLGEVVDDLAERKHVLLFFEDLFDECAQRKKQEEKSFLYTDEPLALETAAAAKEEDSGEESTEPRKKLLLEPVSLAVWAISLVSILLFLGVFLWIFLLGEKESYVASANNSSFSEQRKIFTLYGKLDIFEMREQDELRVFVGKSLYALRLTSISAESLKFQENLNNKEFPAKLWERTFVTFEPEQSLGGLEQNASTMLQSSSKNSDLLVKYQKLSGDIAVVYVENLRFEDSVLNYGVIWKNSSHVSVEKEHVLLENQNKGPINVYVKALQLPVHVSYNLDGKKQNSVNLSIGMDISILAQDHLEIQVGNYKSAAFIVNGIPLTINLEGYNRYSMTKVIKWLASFENETLFDLTIKDYIN